MVKGSHEQYHIIMNEGAKTSGWHLQETDFYFEFMYFSCICLYINYCYDCSLLVTVNVQWYVLKQLILSPPFATLP